MAVDTLEKLEILAEAAKYDAACTSSGAARSAEPGSLGQAMPAGCCHSFTPDGRCVTLLKVLMSNACSFDCAYCVNRRSASCRRATFSPRELAELTVDFYRRNYVEGLFLSSGVMGTPDATTERMIACLEILRDELRFRGYVHAKVIPGTSPELVRRLGMLADRLSVNLELPSAASLAALCPDKGRSDVLSPMAQIARTRDEEEGRLLSEGTAPRRPAPRVAGARAQGEAAATARGLAAGAPRDARGGTAPRAGAARGAPGAPVEEGGTAWGQDMLLCPTANRLTLRRRSRVATARRRFCPAGQSTQLIVGATPEDDNHILQLSESLYRSFGLRRVFFSAYLPMLRDERLPEPGTPVPLRREHRLYQADWLMRYYGFSPDELASPDEPWLDLELDPKLAWALRNLRLFPVEVMEAPLSLLLRVPGVGPVGARRIVAARRTKVLGFDDLRLLRVSLRRARPFLSCDGRRDPSAPLDEELIRKEVAADARDSRYNRARREREGTQLTLF